MSGLFGGGFLCQGVAHEGYLDGMPGVGLAIAVQGGELADPAVGGDDFAVGDRGAIADDKVIIQGQGPCQLPFGVQVAFLVHRVSNLKVLPTARFDPGIGAQGGINGG